jgi:Ca2+-binding RTX toxin-like protein
MLHFASLRRGAIVAVAIAAAAPALASAGTLRLIDDPATGGKVLEFEAAPGERNDFQTMGLENGVMGVTDGWGVGLPITSDPPCYTGAPGWFTGPTFAYCAFADFATIRLLLGDQDDRGGAAPGIGQLKRVIVRGGGGSDVIGGGTVGDDLHGEEGADLLVAYGGNDVLDGGPGGDRFEGGSGDDAVFADDGEADNVDCGDGSDSVRSDAADSLVGCEIVNGSIPGAAPPPQPPAVDATSPRIVARPARAPRLRRLLSRGLKVTLGCGEPCVVRLQLELSRAFARRLGLGRVVVGQVARDLATTTSSRVVVRLSKRARRALREVETVRFTLRISARDRAGNTSEVTRRVKARR